MREVKIDGLDKPVKIRSIRRSEQVGGLDQYGYHLLFYSPSSGVLGEEIDREKAEKGMDLVLAAVLGPQVVQEVDEAGGSAALRKVWLEIIRETYGSKDEEKNSLPAGNSIPTPSGSPTANPAEEPAKNA
jgi:hypothetical protein